jgi:hypothetical protein
LAGIAQVDDVENCPKRPALFYLKFIIEHKEEPEWATGSYRRFLKNRIFKNFEGIGKLIKNYFLSI